MLKLLLHVGFMKKLTGGREGGREEGGEERRRERKKERGERERAGGRGTQNNVKGQCHVYMYHTSILEYKKQNPSM